MEEVLLADGTKVLVPKKMPSGLDDIDADGPTADQDKGFHLLEKVRSAWGSTAGAGSDFFHVYRKQRAREMARLDGLERDWEIEQDTEEFNKRREGRILKVVEKRKTRAARNQRRRQTKRMKGSDATGERRKDVETTEEVVGTVSGEKYHQEKPATGAQEKPAAGAQEPVELKKFIVGSKVIVEDSDDDF